MMKVVNVSESGPDWHWVRSSLARTHPDWQWRHASIHDQAVPRWLPKQYPLRRLAAAFEGVGAVESGGRATLVTHGPRIATYAQLAMRVRRRRVHHIAYTFSFTDLPTGLEHRLMSRWLKGVDRFVCFSDMERRLYADHFDLDVDRFESQLWGVGEPTVEAGGSVVAGDYVCALGVQARDYETLVAAARSLPAIRFVLVALPSALAGIERPANVELYSGISLARAMNILAFSRFTVLPLRGSRVPCGHSTIVPAMHLGKAVVATDSVGVSEYVVDGRNGVLVPPRDMPALRRAIDELYGNPAHAAELGRNGQAFASEHCTEQAVADWFSGYVASTFGTFSASESCSASAVATELSVPSDLARS